MDVDELQQFDSNVDYTEILHIQQKRIITFINNFASKTTMFLNKLANSCESRLMEFEYKLQAIEASLLILESQLASIPDLQVNEVKDSVSENIPTKDVDLPEIMADDKNEALEMEDAQGVPANKDPRFSKFFKMVQVGVPPEAVKLKMQAEGLNPDILDKPTINVPG